MDPNATLAEMVKLATDILEGCGHKELRLSDVYGLAQAVVDLDGWMRKGGFPPRAWDKEKIFRKITPPI